MKGREMAAYSLIIVDDHPLFRDALRQALADKFSDLVITEAGSLDGLSGALEGKSETDLVLLDLAMPGVKGFSGLMYLRAQYPEIPVVVVSANEEPSAIRRCIEFGASGFIPKSLPVETIREAVRTVLEGGVWTPPDLDLDEEGDGETTDLVSRLATLTPQQVRVLMMLSEGLLNKQIAYKLSVSEATIKAHVSAILQKLGVDSRTQAVIAVNKIEGQEWQGSLEQS
jgi:DNA-binding NarL/FixJ family response regulator